MDLNLMTLSGREGDHLLLSEKSRMGEWEDPIVAELRALRDTYAKKFDYDLQAMFNDLFER